MVHLAHGKVEDKKPLLPFVERLSLQLIGLKCGEMGIKRVLLVLLMSVLKDGLRITYFWIKEQIDEKEKTQGLDISKYGSSKVVGTQASVQLGSLRAADGKE
nr:GDP-mannose 3,5-epimerase 1 [Ipomoea batatas]